MSIRVGDAAFIRSGQPGLVRERNTANGALKLDTDLKAVQEDMRHGYLNGIDQEQRQALYDILDQVKGSTADPEERINMLRDKLAELEQNPQNYLLTRYVQAEMTHLMNTHSIRPRLYSVSEYKTR
jgi:energy-coupling factor transporter ATP-binding protein EcfA2